MNIWGNMVVKNEDRFIYFAVLSVIKYLDKLLIWDTGSTDNTTQIIKILKRQFPEKILFKECGRVDASRLSQLRQKMLEESECDWLLLIDGDEVWWEESLNKIKKVMNNDLYAIVSPVVNLVGDIYHYQDEKAGNYEILGRKGHYNIRAINRGIPGLHVKNDFPLEGYYDQDGRLIQEIEDKLIFVDAPYLHLSHLVRSSRNDKTVLHRRKFKYELGKKVNFKYPKVFYEDRPEIVSDPWDKRGKGYLIYAYFQAPFKRIKRLFR